MGLAHQRHRFHGTVHMWCCPQEFDLQLPTQISRDHFFLEGCQSACTHFSRFISTLVVSDHRYTPSTWYRFYEASRSRHWADVLPRCMFALLTFASHPLNKLRQLTSIGLFHCLRRIDVYNHDRLGLALTRSNIRALLRQAAPSLNTFGESQTTTKSQSRVVKTWKVSHSVQAVEEYSSL